MGYDEARVDFDQSYNTLGRRVLKRSRDFPRGVQRVLGIFGTE